MHRCEHAPGTPVRPGGGPAAGPRGRGARGGAEGGQCGGLAGEFTGGRAGGPGRGVQGGREPVGILSLLAVDGIDRFTAEKSLRRFLVKPFVLLVGHHMSFCVQRRECVTPAGATRPVREGR